MRDGKLVFTRVTQAIDDAIPAVISGNIEQEVINTVEYLRRLGFHDSGTLDAYVISSPDVRDALDMKRFNFGSSTVLTPLDVAELLDLEQAALSADRFGDVVMASAICRMNKRLLKLSTAYADKLAKFYLINRGMQAVAALAALALIGLGAQNIMGVLQDKKHIAETELKRQGLQEALNRGKSTVSQLNKDVAFKTAVVAVHDAYFKTRVTPLDFLGKLTGALSPEHRVTEFEWTKPALYKPAGSPAVVPTPRGAAAKKDVPPLEVRVTMTFAGSYAGAQDVNRAAETLLAGFKEAMPEYEIDHEPYPWADLLSKTQEVSFDQDANSQSLPTSGVTYIFRGPKKADKAKGGRV
jgi:hypothetical protein